MKLLSTLIAFAAVATSQAGKRKDDSEPSYDVLLFLVGPDCADLIDDLPGTTVFGPTDKAFAGFLEETGFDVEQLCGEAIDQLTQILLYHVVEGTIKLEDVKDLPKKKVKLETLQGEDIIVNRDDLTVNGIEIIDPDAQLTPFVLHGIDGVLIPPAPKPTKPTRKPTKPKRKPTKKPKRKPTKKPTKKRTPKIQHKVKKGYCIGKSGNQAKLYKCHDDKVVHAYFDKEYGLVRLEGGDYCLRAGLGKGKASSPDRIRIAKCDKYDYRQIFSYSHVERYWLCLKKFKGDYNNLCVTFKGANANKGDNIVLREPSMKSHRKLGKGRSEPGPVADFRFPWKIKVYKEH